MTEAERNAREALEKYITTHKIARAEIERMTASAAESDEDKLSTVKRIHLKSAEYAHQMGRYLIEMMIPEDRNALMLPLYNIMLTVICDSIRDVMKDYMEDMREIKGCDIPDTVLAHIWDEFEEEQNGNH